MKKVLISALALSVALGAGIAGARGMGDMQSRTLPSFEELDVDGSGGISRDDLAAFADAQRTARSTDAVSGLMESAGEDGLLSAEELAAGLQAQRDQRIETRQQARADTAAARLMEAAGEDGLLSAEELSAVLDAQRADRGQGFDRGERGERGEGRAERGGDRDDRGKRGEHRADRGGERRGGGDRMDPAQMGARLFDRVDANNDDVVDMSEYAAFAERMAERMDRR